MNMNMFSLKQPGGGIPNVTGALQPGMMFNRPTVSQIGGSGLGGLPMGLPGTYQPPIPGTFGNLPNLPGVNPSLPINPQNLPGVVPNNLNPLPGIALNSGLMLPSMRQPIPGLPGSQQQNLGQQPPKFPISPNMLPGTSNLPGTQANKPFGFPQQNVGFPQQNIGFPQQSVGFPQQNVGFPSQSVGFPPQNLGFPPQIPSTIPKPPQK